MEFILNSWFLLLMLTFATAFNFVWLYIFNRDKLHASWWEILIVCLVHTIYGVITVKFFALLEVGFNTSIAGNMSLFGGIFFMPIMYCIYALIKKLPMPLVFDVFVISLALTLALARINCLYSGCCLGKTIGDSGLRYPTREIDIAINALFIAIFATRIIKNEGRGIMYPLYLISYGLGRFIIEWFRESESLSNYHIGHTWSIVSFVVGTLIISLVFFSKRSEKHA